MTELLERTPDLTGPAAPWMGDTLGQVEEALLRRRAADADLLVLAARWADENPPEITDTESGRAATKGVERAVRLGGEGTPLVAEFCPAELGISLGGHHHAARHLMGDALDLRHRLHGLWQATTTDLTVEAWVARKIARATRHLTPTQAAEIDTRLADETEGGVAGTLPASRLLSLVEALVMACDTETEEVKRKRERRARFVHVNQSSQHGTKGLWAKLDSVDAIKLDAQVDRLARILHKNPRPDDPRSKTGTRPTLDECRSEALGLLANPAAALHLLATHEPVALGQTPGLAAFFAGLDPGHFQPAATLFVHLTESDFTRDADGIARFHGNGTDNATPITLAHAREILGHHHVTVRPVIDLPAVRPADAYEFTGTLREAVFLRTPADCFPHAVNTSRRLQVDHTTPYDASGKAGQTRLDNAGPMTQIHHRIATHGRWRRRQPRSGVFVWATPHGRYRLTNHTGTHTISPALGDAIFDGTGMEAALATLLLPG